MACCLSQALSFIRPHGSNTHAPLLWPQVGAQLEGSFARRRARLEKERREAAKREWEDSYTDFVKWCVLVWRLLDLLGDVAHSLAHRLLA